MEGGTQRAEECWSAESGPTVTKLDITDSTRGICFNTHDTVSLSGSLWDLNGNCMHLNTRLDLGWQSFSEYTLSYKSFVVKGTTVLWLLTMSPRSKEVPGLNPGSAKDFLCGLFSGGFLSVLLLPAVQRHADWGLIIWRFQIDRRYEFEWLFFFGKPLKAERSSRQTIVEVNPLKGLLLYSHIGSFGHYQEFWL